MPRRGPATILATQWLATQWLAAACVKRRVCTRASLQEAATECLKQWTLPGPAKNIHGPLGPGQARTVEPAAPTCTGTEDPPAAVRLAGTAQLAPPKIGAKQGKTRATATGERQATSSMQTVWQVRSFGAKSSDSLMLYCTMSPLLAAIGIRNPERM